MSMASALVKALAARSIRSEKLGVYLSVFIFENIKYHFSDCRIRMLGKITVNRRQGYYSSLSIGESKFSRRDAAEGD